MSNVNGSGQKAHELGKICIGSSASTKCQTVATVQQYKAWQEERRVRTQSQALPFANENFSALSDRLTTPLKHISNQACGSAFLAGRFLW